MKYSRKIVAAILTIIVFAASLTPAFAEESEPVGLSVASTPDGTDITIDAWELSLHVPAGIQYKLDSENGDFYIYAMGDSGIPYVMIHSFEGVTEVEEFMKDHIEHLKEKYTDLEIIEDIQDFDAGKYMFLGAQSEYTISGGYKVLDTRLAIQNNDRIIMIAVKEVPELEYFADELFVQVLEKIVLKGAAEIISDVDPVPEDETGTEPKSFLTTN